MIPTTKLNLLLLQLGCILYSNAIEIIPTHEWTLLQEGDTIPAGLHIQMDLSTGEKWVKLPENYNHNNDDTEPREEIISVVGEEGTFSAQITPDGSVALVRNPDGSPTSSTSRSTSTSTLTLEDILDQESDPPHKPKKPHYDFEMMHRTLSKLGKHEIERMGLPDYPPPEASLVLRKTFEAHMVDIWTSRQKELADLELADLPKLLKLRIQAIERYIENGVISMEEVNDDDDNEDDNDNENENYMEFVLNDLEYQLTDLDNARDFHTLNGWPYLVSLLSDGAHTKALPSMNESPITHTTPQTITIQTLAAWSIGTAVKNVEEFASWALEDVSTLDVVSIPSKQRITVLDLLLHQFQTTLNNDTTHEPFPESEVTLDHIRMLQQKIVYALGSLLRFNPPAQDYFISLHGPHILEQFLQTHPSNSNLSHQDISLLSKIIHLGSDIIVETSQRINNAKHSSIHKAKSIQQAFATSSWCHASPQLAHRHSQTHTIAALEQILQAMDIMASVCLDSWGEDVLSMLSSVTTTVRENEDIDTDWKEEILGMTDGIRSKMDSSIGI